MRASAMLRGRDCKQTDISFGTLELMNKRLIFGSWNSGLSKELFCTLGLWGHFLSTNSFPDFLSSRFILLQVS